MADVLLMSTAEKGHLNPLIGVAKWLMRRDHRVGWCCVPEAPPYLADMGVEPVPVDLPEPDEEFVTDGAELAKLVRDPDRLYHWLHTLLVERVDEQVEPTWSAVADWGPDAVVADSMRYPGIIAAHLEELPWAGVSTTLNLVAPGHLDGVYQEHLRRMSADRREVFEQYGLSPSFKLTGCISPFLNTVFTTPEYVGDAGEVPEGVHQVGPSFPPGERGDEVEFPWGALDDRPTVYASFGSQIYHQPEMFERVARATEPLDVQVVFSCGELANASWADDLPEHVIAVEYTPQRALLERVDLMITHGGANSVREAVAAAVPLLVSPVCNDQPIQAYFVREAGVGVELDLYEATDDSARETIRRLLKEGAPERERVREMAAGYREADGARRTAELVEEELL